MQNPMGVAANISGVSFATAIAALSIGGIVMATRKMPKMFWDKWLEEGIREGIQKGIQKGIQEGIEIGKEAGREAGREEGLKEGREAGREAGREEFIKAATGEVSPETLERIKERLREP